MHDRGHCDFKRVVRKCPLFNQIFNFIFEFKHESLKFRVDDFLIVCLSTKLFTTLN